MGCCFGEDFDSSLLQKNACKASQAIKCWLSGQRVQTTGEQVFSVINESTTSDSWCLGLVLQDEIWSEIVLKRLRTVRDRIKEGLFGNVPYSFMTSSHRTRYTVIFLVMELCGL